MQIWTRRPAGVPFVVSGLHRGGGEEDITWNPSDKGANITLSNGNLDATGATAFHSVRATTSRSSGKKYFEILLVAADASGSIIGAMDGSGTLTTYVGNSANGFGHQNNGTDYVTGDTLSNDPATTYTTNDVVNIAIDFGAGSAWLGKNGSWVTGDPAAGTSPWVTGISGAYFPTYSTANASNAGRLRTKNAQFTGSVPSGFTSWATP